MRPFLPLVVFALIYPLLDRLIDLHAVPAACQILIYAMLAQGLNIVVGFAGLLHLGYAAFFAIAFAFSTASPIVPTI